MKHGQGWCAGECCNGPLPEDSPFEVVKCPECSGHDCAICDWQGSILVLKTASVVPESTEGDK